MIRVARFGYTSLLSTSAISKINMNTDEVSMSYI